MSYEFLGSTRDGKQVVFENEASHAVTHFADTPGLKQLVKEVIAQTVSSGKYIWFETNLGRAVGNSDLVETTNVDDIVFAQRPNRDGYARFTKSQEAQPSAFVTVALDPLDEDRLELTSAWIGPIGAPFPDSPAAAPESMTYWSHHALVWGTQVIVPGTERTDNPWKT